MSAKFGVTKKSGCAEAQIGTVSIGTQCGLSSLRGRHIRRAEQQRPHGCFHFHGHLWPGSCASDGFVGLRDVPGLHVVVYCGRRNQFDVANESLPAHRSTRAAEQSKPSNYIAENRHEFRSVKPGLTTGFVLFGVRHRVVLQLLAFD